MSAIQKTYEHIEHASTCAYTLDARDDCTCFYSALSKTSVFLPATREGPAEKFGRNKEEQTDIDNFVERKRCAHGEVPSIAHPPGLYAALIPGEIRVIEIYAAGFDAPLEGKLHVVSVDFDYEKRWQSSGTYYVRHTNHAISLITGSPFWYTALSYTWGAPIFDQSISFEHGSVKITSSLATALRHLRSTDHSVFLWVDQICINQADLAEKAHQIPLMGMIYAHATNTLIWLGEDTESSAALAYDTMETVFARLQGTEAKVVPDDFPRLSFPDSKDKSWWAILQLLRRPWFTRVWTIQEAHLSRELFLKCGDSVACWDDFAVWCYTLEDSGLLRWLSNDKELEQLYCPKEPEKLPQAKGAQVVDDIQQGRTQGLTLVQKAYLLETLVLTRYAEATDLRDKVYGVLAMVEEKVVPDYRPTTTARAVYHQACLTQLPHLTYELLSCVDHDVPVRPSWTPDWSVPRKTEALGYLTKAWASYSAGGPNFDPNGKRKFTVSLNDDKTELMVLGKIVDEVAHLGVVCQEPKLDLEDPASGNPELASYIVMASSKHHDVAYAAPGILVFDAFLNTLLAGRDGAGVDPPSQDHIEVFSLIVDSITGHMDSLPGQTYSPRRRKGFFTLQSLKTRKPAKTLEDLETALRAALKMRRFAVTKKGFFALVPRGTKEGDVILVAEKACVPFVVRKASNDAAAKKFELLGECYVQGIMKGEAMKDTDSKLETITLV